MMAERTRQSSSRATIRIVAYAALAISIVALIVRATFRVGPSSLVWIAVGVSAGAAIVLEDIRRSKRQAREKEGPR